MLNPAILFSAFLLPSWLYLSVVADAIQISIPSSLPSSHVVQQNFLGISFELSYVDYYCKSLITVSIRSE